MLKRGITGNGYIVTSERETVEMTQGRNLLRAAMRVMAVSNAWHVGKDGADTVTIALLELERAVNVIMGGVPWPLSTESAASVESFTGRRRVGRKHVPLTGSATRAPSRPTAKPMPTSPPRTQNYPGQAN